MSVVTIQGQLGSGAPEIGKLVADKIHTDYVDREIIANVAEMLNTRNQDVIEKEMPPGSFWGRIAQALTRGYYGPAVGPVSYEGAYLPAWEISLDDTRYLSGLESVIKELAASESIVIRGRGSQFILKDNPRALHVLLVAPLELRVKRVMEDTKIDEQTAKKEITRFDSSRREFIKRYFKAEPEDPLYHDLVINTERLSFEDAASIIVGTIPFKEGTTTKGS